MRRPLRRVLLTILLLVLLLAGLFLLNAYSARAPANDLAEPVGTTDVESVALVSFTLDSGAGGVMPEAWDAIETGTYVSPARDATFVVQQLPPVPLGFIAPVVLNNMGLSGDPAVAATREVNAIAWSLYETTADGKPVDFALGEGQNANYLLLLQSPVGQRDAFYDDLFLPMIDAFGEGTVST